MSSAPFDPWTALACVVLALACAGVFGWLMQSVREIDRQERKKDLDW